MLSRGLVGRLWGRGRRSGLLIVRGGGIVGVAVVVVCLRENLGRGCEGQKVRVGVGLVTMKLG